MEGERRAQPLQLSEKGSEETRTDCWSRERCEEASTVCSRSVARLIFYQNGRLLCSSGEGGALFVHHLLRCGPIVVLHLRLHFVRNFHKEEADHLTRRFIGLMSVRAASAGPRLRLTTATLHSLHREDALGAMDALGRCSKRAAVQNARTCCRMDVPAVQRDGQCEGKQQEGAPLPAVDQTRSEAASGCRVTISEAGWQRERQNGNRKGDRVPQ